MFPAPKTSGWIFREIKTDEFQAQLFLTADIHLVVDVLEIGFDRRHFETHLKGDLLDLVALTGQIGHLALAGRQPEPAIVEIQEVFIGCAAATRQGKLGVLLVGWVSSVDKV